MARFTLVLCILSTFAASASAQDRDPMALRSQLRDLQSGAEHVESGLAAIQRELMSIGIRVNDENGAARLELTLEDHFVGLTPISAMFALDGQPMFHSVDVAQIETGQIFSGAIPSGPHILSVELVYRGDILYTTGDRTRIRSSYAFGTTLDRTTHVRVIGHDTSVLAAPADRRAIDYVVETDPAE